MKIMYYFETVAAKVVLSIYINVLMKLNEYQKSWSLFDYVKRSLRFQNLNLFFSETIESYRTKFHMKAYG